MYSQSSFTLAYIRIAFCVVFTVVMLMLSASMVTAVGSNTVLDSRSHPTVSTPSAESFDDPNAVASGAAELGASIQHGYVSAGRSLFGACLTLTNVSEQIGHNIANGTVAVVVGTGRGVLFVANGVGNRVAYTVKSMGKSALYIGHLPGNIVGSIHKPKAVSSFIRPADDAEVPVINSKTSAEQLAQFDARQKAEIAKLLAEQVTANSELGGSIVAGDPNHGGYPARLDNARQDALTDNWGMFNRECVSYAAWKVHQTFGNMPYWGGVGNANEWVGNAKRAGIATGKIPLVHSVAISMQGYYGHAMWVEKVKGNMIYVSQYNYDLNGRYSEMWIDGSRLSYIYFK